MFEREAREREVRSSFQPSPPPSNPFRQSACMATISRRHLPHDKLPFQSDLASSTLSIWKLSRDLESKSMTLKEKATVAVEAITADSDNG
ncbi:unnamed protein product [Linum trigynum]|uniref:Uncharacterized protein n=1 Tax=Linum trigynum TaxID=586398 RepID=A0AAV2FXG9_9ROSI